MAPLPERGRISGPRWGVQGAGALPPAPCDSALHRRAGNRHRVDVPPDGQRVITARGARSAWKYIYFSN
ncbi:hypothetical protein [Streptomyces sp. NPDC002889]|uniref:hypothetical protein n=1 Tax=Streptomyces sp. NPDC002889 TaxID=3364669 RepID=UPI00369177F8